MRIVLFGILSIIFLLAAGFFILNSYTYQEKQDNTANDYKSVSYVIDGEHVQLDRGMAETEAAPGSASAVVTQYFGNEFYTDLNDDGREDVVFILTQESGGGSGTFYYAVAALNTEEGYVGSDGYLLGDRVAPQTINESENPRHVNVIVVNYADRAPGESMTANPSVSKSAYLKLDPASMQWGTVEPDFEGESALPVWGDPITVRGEIACLPKRTTGPQTLECAIGLKADDRDDFYALKNLFEHDPNYSLSQTGTRLEVIGTVTQEEMHGPDGNPYDIVGVITITSIQEL
jgi:hypothetical protein